MRKMYFFVVALLVSALVKAQFSVVDFETLTLPPDSFWNGSDYSNGFTSNQIAYFPNQYYDWGGGITSWTGFAYSNMIDTLTQSFSNQYSTYAGYQTANSNIFAISYNGIDWMTNEVIPNYVTFYSIIDIISIDVTNTTYAALTMLNGDSYSKKFGGTNGDDPDWFKLTIFGYLNDSVTNSVEFYLADYRFQDNQLDYIVKDWTTVDLSVLGKVNKIGFVLSSSDTGLYGMNTPAYFCLDNIKYNIELNKQTVYTSKNKVNIFPNPVSNILYFSKPVISTNIYDIYGKVIFSATNTSHLNIESLPSGVYVIEIKTQDSIEYQNFIKK